MQRIVIVEIYYKDTSWYNKIYIQYRYNFLSVCLYVALKSLVYFAIQCYIICNKYHLNMFEYFIVYEEIEFSLGNGCDINSCEP